MIRYIDLCCGIGGFRVGIQLFEKQHKKIKFECVYSADIKSDAVKTYNVNFAENMECRDIYEISELPEFDLLCAGFPCQPFSSAGKKQGFQDERGGMIFKIFELCKKYQPKYFILENVANLLNLEKGKLIEQINDMFKQLNYKISYNKLNSKDFGIPQSRDRVYIVGTKDKSVDFNVIIPYKKVLIKDIIDYDIKKSDIKSDLCNKVIKLHLQTPLHGYKLNDKRGGEKNIHSWDIDYYGEVGKDEKTLLNKIMTERRKKHWASVKNIEWMDGMPLTETEIKTFYNHSNLKNILNNLVNLGYLKLEKCKDLVNGKREYKKDSNEGYNICKGKLSFPISKILDPLGISPTLTATDSCKLVLIIDDTYVRKLTDKELKRICGFPDNFIIPSNVNKYDLFGNMVTPPVITFLLEKIFIF